MGFYVLGDTEHPNRGKAEALIRYGAWEIERPYSFDDIPNDQFLIAVVLNVGWEAALIVYDEEEWRRTVNDMSSDPRPVRYLVMDREKVLEMVNDSVKAQIVNALRVPSVITGE